MEELQNLLSKPPLSLDKGFEIHPFLIGDYNEKVGPKFRLPYEDKNLAFVLISLPSMFEKTFIPFLVAEGGENEFLTDPLDACMKALIQETRTRLLESSFQFIFYHDFDLHPNRRPKVLVQTAGHVSGAVHLFRSPNLNPVCLHPKYGGWFALRGVFIFPSISCPSLRIQEPFCPLQSIQDIEELLILYNHHWKDGRYRDFIPVQERYSNLQRIYFDTLPSERISLLKKLLNEYF